MADRVYKSKEEVIETAAGAVGKVLRQFIPRADIAEVERTLMTYGTDRKGYFGDLVEKYVFGIDNNARPEADFSIAGVELKTTPLRKHPKLTYAAKERLVFSMIDYDKVVAETWDKSTFLSKNRFLLLLFYLYVQGAKMTDYEFKYSHFLDLLSDISEEDVLQIRKDWEYIVEKIRRGEAHLLSEGDTYYLGACTKARDSSVVRDQPRSRVPAKPRAFSLKQQYLNFLIQKRLLGRDISRDSIFRRVRKVATIEEAMHVLFAPFLVKTDTEIRRIVRWEPETKPKNYKRLLIDKLLGLDANHIEELEKANVTLRVVTLEHTGTLRESISFPAFDYKELVGEPWYDDKREVMSAFHAELETKKFLFVVFQKQKRSDDIVLRKVLFWNFPMQDIAEAERVFEKTKDCIREGRYEDLPKISESRVSHVRPHGQDGSDTIETPQGTQEVRRCFWLNAKYIQGFLQ